MDIIEACGSYDAVRGSTSCPFTPTPTQTRLQIAVSDELKLVAILEKKITVCACLLSSEGCDSFSKDLDLALAPNKTNEGVKKQWSAQ